MKCVRVTFVDGNVIETNINGTDPEILNYYLGQSFQFGDTEECPHDKLVAVASVQFL